MVDPSNDEDAVQADNETHGETVWDPAAPVRDESFLLRLFVGKNADRFLAVHHFQTGSATVKKNGALDFINVPAAFFSVAWCFYRKLYLEGVAVLLIPAVFVYLFPDAMIQFYTGWAVLVSAAANSYYVSRSLRKIRGIEGRAIPQMDRDEIIRGAGGTSIPGAVLGTVVASGVVIAWLFFP